jgi:hypothetical protein
MDVLSHFWDDIFSGLPDLLVAVIVLIVAIIVALLVQFLVKKLLKLIGVTKGLQKAGVSDENIKKTMSFVGRLTFLVVFFLFLPGIFEKLGLASISTPIVAMMNDFMAYLPKIIGAIIILLVGLFIAKLLKELLKPILNKTKLNSGLAKLGLDLKKVNVADVIVNIIYTVVAIFFAVEAINTLQLEVLTHIGTEIIGYLPLAVSAVIIMLLAYLLGIWVEGALIRNFKTSKATALVVKIAIIVIGVFITLYQLGVAPAMINAAFVIMLGAIGVAFAIAFGIGGRDFAAHTMAKFEKRLNDGASTNKAGNKKAKK